MPKKKAVEPKRRTKVKELPKKETTLNENEMKKVKGGSLMGGVSKRFEEGDPDQPIVIGSIRR